MEKLRVAIEKARAQRAGGRQEISAPPLAAAKGQDLWAALPATEIRANVVRRHRLVSHGGGHGAGPYDLLRTRILQQAAAKDWRRVALVSPHPGSGKSTTAANLAFSFGRQSDRRLMVIDLDLRRIGLAKVLGLSCPQGMADVLEGRISFAEHGLRLDENVALGLNERPVKNSAELLQSQKTQEVLGRIEADYRPDIMLFDLPPVLVTDDSLGFLKNVDCALLLAEIGKTTVDQIDEAERQIAELTNVMGVVLNKCAPYDTAHGYGYDYGYD